ncbi:7-cyano-7-deazaguanine synthase [Psychroserpens sp. XS_ASV72]|uniref:7-cyano-7-deazaguanine synthase n=1 Tax=Psychroserpens sp. XS_ASV72 TaxID=3241293 RepID=UPI003518D90D
MKEKSKVLILLSGGLDSTALIDYYIRRNFSVFALFINYGQIAYEYELKAVKEISSFYNIEAQFLNTGFKNYFQSGEIVGRNLLLLSLAFTYYAKAFGIIALGIHSGTDYIDCTQDFVKNVQESFDMYTNGQTQIDVPFVNLNKGEIWKYCLDNKVPIEMTYSCEKGVIHGCGVCLSCKDKKSLYEFSKNY